jgi:hypothetical protein
MKAWFAQRMFLWHMARSRELEKRNAHHIARAGFWKAKQVVWR